MSKLRQLSEYEIESIISFIVPQQGIPPETSMSVVNSNKNRLKQQLIGQMIYPEMIPRLKHMIEKQYNESLIQAGESVGVISAQSIGEKQTQSTLNSVDWTEIVLYIVDGKTKVEPIGQMIDGLLDNKDNNDNIKLYQNALALTKNKTEYLELSDGYYIPSGNENGFNEWLKIEAVTRHLPSGKLVKVVTHSGRTVMASQCKSFLVWNGNKFIDTLGSDIKVGDIVPTTKNLIKPKIIYEYLDLFTILPNYCTYGFLSNMTTNILLDKDFGFFVGIYLAKGFCDKTRVCINIDDVNIIKRITDFCDHYKIVYNFVKNGVYKYINIHSILLAKLFKIICDNNGSRSRVIPEFAYTASTKFITGLLDGYFSCNGYVNEKHGYIIVGSVSEQLIYGVSFLLSYMGIFGSISRKYTLSIKNEFVKKFSTKIKLTEVNKQRILKELNKKHNKCDSSQRYFPSNRDVYFDSVVSIEYVNATNGLVYDFTVAKTRNFNLFNGLNLRDTFHKAGSGEKTVTTGVPRVEEILNATKDPRSVNCIVYTKKHHKSIAELRKTVGYEVVELTFAKITKECKIEMNKKPEPWYEAFKIMYGDEFIKFTDCVSLTLDMDILYEYKLDMEKISQIIAKNYSDMICVFSPDNIGQLDVFVDTSNIDLPENRLEFIDSDNAKEIYLEEVVQPILYKIIICGVPGIENIYFNDDPNNFETYGSNFKKLLGLPFVDYTKTISNDVWDIYNTLGIEAARQFLIEEFMQLCSGINLCHIQLLAEKMTYTGAILSISRYTMRNEDCGPMGKASFEETMDNFLKAGAYGQKEATRGVSASIICGKRASIGTGVCELIIDVKSLPNNVNVLNNNVKETIKTSAFISTNKSQKIECKNVKKFEEKLEKQRLKPKLVIDSDSESDEDKYIQLTEKDFKNCKYKAKVYFGTADINTDAEVNEDGFANEEEGLILSFDSKVPQEVTLTWKDGIKVGKEVFSGFNSTYGVYTLLDGVDLSDQGRFMRIIGNPVKMKKSDTKSEKKSDTKSDTKSEKKSDTKSEKKSDTKSEKKSDNDDTEQMGYLDF